MEQLKQLAVNQWQMLECKMTLEPHPVQTVLLPRAHRQSAAGVADRQGKKQAENSFAIIAGTKALAAVAIESEEWKGYTHIQTTACLGGRNNVLQELFAFTAVVFFTCVSMHIKKRVSMLYNNNTVV